MVATNGTLDQSKITCTQRRCSSCNYKAENGDNALVATHYVDTNTSVEYSSVTSSHHYYCPMKKISNIHIRLIIKRYVVYTMHGHSGPYKPILFTHYNFQSSANYVLVVRQPL